jgi:hypothetical protein
MLKREIDRCLGLRYISQLDQSVAKPLSQEALQPMSAAPAMQGVLGSVRDALHDPFMTTKGTIH